MVRTYVTVAIPYVNARPHLGYAYELVLADVYARARRQAGAEVRFLGGTDDYSLKNVLAAQRAGVGTEAFVAAHAAQFEALASPLALTFDDFIRTSSDPRHAPAVARLWRACAERGDLYRREYEGEYCVGCEQFYGADELVYVRCPDHGTPPEHVVEDNWFFRLSAYQDRIESLIASGELAIRPVAFRDEILAFVRGGLDDVSVSRSTRRARGWGIGVPADPDQVVYVWFDALTNYVSALGFGDPESADFRTWWVDADERVHVIGKGILRFHAVYWPAFLASAGVPLPTRIQVHPYLTVDGDKISKSSGSRADPALVDPAGVVEAYGADALRWWFARDVASVADTDYTTERLVARANEDLAHGLGNVTNRVVALVHRYRGGVVPSVDAAPVDGVADLDGAVLRALTDFELRAGARLVVDAVTALNRDLETTRPWDVAKRDGAGDSRTLDALLARHIRTARLIARAAAPIVPDLAARLRDQLGADGSRLGPPDGAFARLDRP